MQSTQTKGRASPSATSAKKARKEKFPPVVELVHHIGIPLMLTPPSKPVPEQAPGAPLRKRTVPHTHVVRQIIFEVRPSPQSMYDRIKLENRRAKAKSKAKPRVVTRSPSPQY